MRSVADTVPNVEDIADWLRERQPHFRDWKPGTLKDWLEWWARSGALGVVRDGLTVLAVGVAYPCTEAQLDKHWNTPDPAGIYLYCELVVAQRRRSALGLLVLLNRQWPDWRERILVARRRNQVQTFGLNFLRRWARRLALPTTPTLSLMLSLPS